MEMNKKKQYWMKLRYSDGVERWELTRGQFQNRGAALKSYEARAYAMHCTLLNAKPHEQFELALDVAEIERRNGLEIGPDGTVKEIED